MGLEGWYLNDNRARGGNNCARPSPARHIYIEFGVCWVLLCNIIIIIISVNNNKIIILIIKINYTAKKILIKKRGRD